jgi:hypothetical protein
MTYPPRVPSIETLIQSGEASSSQRARQQA